MKFKFGLSYLISDIIGNEPIIRDYILSEFNLNKYSPDFVVVNSKEDLVAVYKKPFETNQVIYIPEVEASFQNTDFLLKVVEQPKPYQVYILHSYNFMRLSLPLYSRCIRVNSSALIKAEFIGSSILEDKFISKDTSLNLYLNLLERIKGDRFQKFKESLYSCLNINTSYNKVYIHFLLRRFYGQRV